MHLSAPLPAFPRTFSLAVRHKPGHGLSRPGNNDFLSLFGQADESCKLRFGFVDGRGDHGSLLEKSI
jgi:hypothetical protein